MSPGGWKLWKRMTFIVAFPAIGLGMVNAYLAHQEHHHDERPEFVPFEYLRVRTKVIKLMLEVCVVFKGRHSNCDVGISTMIEAYVNMTRNSLCEECIC